MRNFGFFLGLGILLSTFGSLETFAAQETIKCEFSGEIEEAPPTCEAAPGVCPISIHQVTKYSCKLSKVVEVSSCPPGYTSKRPDDLCGGSNVPGGGESHGRSFSSWEDCRNYNASSEGKIYNSNSCKNVDFALVFPCVKDEVPSPTPISSDSPSPSYSPSSTPSYYASPSPSDSPSSTPSYYASPSPSYSPTSTSSYYLSSSPIYSPSGTSYDPR